MLIINPARLLSLWQKVTEPSPEISSPDERQRARSIAATLLLTVAIILIPLLQNLFDRVVPPYLAQTLIAAIFCYFLSRTRYYRVGGVLAIAVLCISPTYALLIGYSDRYSFLLGTGRLLLMALLATYVLYSLRASLMLALLIGGAFIFVSPSSQPNLMYVEMTTEFLLTTSAVFAIFAIARQYDTSARKQVEAALSASDERYRGIVELQTEMICRWLPDETITFVNEACRRYFDKSREEIIGLPAFTSVYPADLTHVKQMISQITRENPSVTYEHRVQKPDGEIRWHQWTDHAIYDDAGNIVEYQSVGRDVTDLKRAEAAERKQREFAEALASTAALISSTLNLEEVLDRILDQAASLNSVNSAEIILLDGDHAYVARSRANINSTDYSGMLTTHFSVQGTRNLREMAETGKAINIPDVREYEGWLPTKAAAWVRSAVGAPIRLEGETIGFLSMNSHQPGVFTELDAQHLHAYAAQAAIAIRNARMYDEVRRYADDLEAQVRQRTYELELAHQRQSAILNGTDEGIFYTEDNVIKFANVAFGKLTGYSPEEFIGQTYPIFYTGSNPEEAADKVAIIRDVIRNEGVWRGEFRLKRKDGSSFEAGLTISLIGSAESRPFRAVTVVRDISREKALHAQRSNLVAYASHELRTPITNMKTRLYLLRRRPEDLENHLLILDEVTERMRRLVEDLLDISRLEHGLIPLKRQEISLQDVVGTVVTHQQAEAERKSLTLRCAMPESVVYVSADRDRLIQVITNLVTNAINYTHAGGEVTVSLSEVNGHAQIEVEDTGIGIAPENLPYIFQPFYRVVSEVEGTGLGLSIVKEIVNLHNGTLHVESELSRGSVFTITLPVRIPTAHPV